MIIAKFSKKEGYVGTGSEHLDWRKLIFTENIQSPMFNGPIQFLTAPLIVQNTLLVSVGVNKLFLFLSLRKVENPFLPDVSKLVLWLDWWSVHFR
jgi:hypothetical protein